MGILSSIADAAKDIAHGARGFARGLLDGTTKGNSIGSLIGIMAGVGFAITGFVSGGIVPALVMGVGLGAACGVIGGAAIGSLRGAAKNGHDIAEHEHTISQELVAPTATPHMQQAVAQDIAQAAAPIEPQAAQRDEQLSFQNRIALEREAVAKGQLAAHSR